LIVGPLLAGARPLRLDGRVVDRAVDRSPARASRSGNATRQHYHHPADDAAGALAGGFVGDWLATAGADGRYAFETIADACTRGARRTSMSSQLDAGRCRARGLHARPGCSSMAPFLWRTSVGTGGHLAPRRRPQRRGRDRA
jgi:hypothetical protein